MNQTSLPLKSWLNKGLSLVLLLTLLSSGFLLLNSVKTKTWFNWSKLNFGALLLACMALILTWLVEAIRVRLIAAGWANQSPSAKC